MNGTARRIRRDVDRVVDEGEEQILADVVRGGARQRAGDAAHVALDQGELSAGWPMPALERYF